MSTVVNSVLARACPDRSLYRRRNPVVRLWRGDIALFCTFCINATLTTASFVVAAARYYWHVEDWPLIAAVTVTIVVPVVLMCAVTCSIVGSWRSARRSGAGGSARVDLTGAKCAKGMCVIAILGVFSLLGSVAEQLKVRWPDARDPFRAELTANGTALILTGRLGLGSAAIVRRSLNRAPRVKTLILESHGGQLSEAFKMWQLVEARALNTYVRTWCSSACTFVYLAGKHRYATRTARVGFHGGTFSGGATGQAQGTEAVLHVYRALGISDAFLKKVAATTGTSIWYPTYDELIANRIVTQLTDVDDSSAEVSESQFRSKQDVQRVVRKSTPMKALETRWPGTIDRATEAGWQAHQQGASDADVASAIQRVGSARYRDLLLHVNDELLEEYLQLLVDQLAAARAISLATCSGFVTGTVDVGQVLPPDLIQREQAWLLKAASATSNVTQPLVDRARFTEALNRVLRSVPSALVAVAADPSAYIGRPTLHCEGLIAFYEEISRQPRDRRALVFRGMLQQGG